MSSLHSTVHLTSNTEGAFVKGINLPLHDHDPTTTRPSDDHAMTTTRPSDDHDPTKDRPRPDHAMTIQLARCRRTILRILRKRTLNVLYCYVAPSSATTRPSDDHAMTTTRPRPDRDPTTTRPSDDHAMTKARPRHDHAMTNNRPSWCKAKCLGVSISPRRLPAFRCASSG